MSKIMQNNSFTKAQTIQHSWMRAAKRPQRGILLSLAFFEAGILYIFGHIPTNAYVLDYSPIALHVVYGLSSEKLHSIAILAQGPSGLYHFPL